MKRPQSSDLRTPRPRVKREHGSMTIFYLIQEALFGLTPPSTVEAARLLKPLKDRVQKMTGSKDEKEAAASRVCRCIKALVELLNGHQVEAVKWLTSPQPALEGDVPWDLAIGSEKGALEVEQLLGWIRHGDYA